MNAIVLRTFFLILDPFARLSLLTLKTIQYIQTKHVRYVYTQSYVNIGDVMSDYFYVKAIIHSPRGLNYHIKIHTLSNI